MGKDLNRCLPTIKVAQNYYLFTHVAWHFEHARTRTGIQTDSQNDLVVCVHSHWMVQITAICFLCIYQFGALFDIDTSQNLASCSIMADFCNTDIFNFGK